MGAVKKYWKACVILTAYLAAVGFLMRHSPEMPWIILGVIGLFASTAALTKLPHLTRWAERNAAWARLLGLIVVILGPASIFVAVYLSGGEMEDGWITGSVVVLMIIGALIFTLPNFNRNKSISEEMIASSPAPAVTEVGLINEVKASLAFVLENLATFARLAAPWVLLNLMLNLAAIHLLSLPDNSDAKLNGGIAFLIGYSLVLAVALPAIAVAWHRYVMRGELPAWGIVPPNKRFWRYFYRVWLFSFVVGTLDKLVSSNAPDMARLFGVADIKLITGGLEDFVLLVAVWGAGMYSLVLPAVAVDDGDVDMTIAMRLIWARRLQFATGFLATVVIFYAVIMGLGLIQDRLTEADNVLSIAISVLSFVMILGATVTSATYLSRAYMRAKGQSLAA